MRVIGLTGAKQSGKSSLATALVADYGFTRLSMAQPLRNMLYAMGLDEADLADPARKESPHPGLCGKSPRHAIQTLGTDWGRAHIGVDVWVNAMEREIRSLAAKKPNASFVIDDIRFQNETALIQRLGGKIWRIRRAAAEAVTDAHESEQHWRTLPFDSELHNATDIPTLVSGAVQLLRNPENPDPRWLKLARSRIGIREIPGPKHNSNILEWIGKLTPKRLGMVISDDETPWCGTFVASVMLDSGVEPPPVAARALSWADWGQTLATPVLGAILVFKRPGGGHVGFYAGEDDLAYHVLGGNQSNAVNVARIEKARCVAIRWPAAEPVFGDRVFVSTNGKPVSRNEV